MLSSGGTRLRPEALSRTVTTGEMYEPEDAVVAGLLDVRTRIHLQREAIHRSEILPWTSLQHDDVPRARRMLDVLGRVETGGDLQAQHLDVKAAASLDVIALQRAVSKSLRQVTAAGKAIDG